METHDDPAAAEQQFQCIICLELVFKPIVHACGHLFCFWCVHRAMNGAYKNFCPLCRRPYMHFPRICEQLHCVLLKAVKEKYLVREKETLEEEEQEGIFSPSILPPPPPRPRSMATTQQAESLLLLEDDTGTTPSSNVSSSGNGSVYLSHSSSSNGDNPSSSEEPSIVDPSVEGDPSVGDPSASEEPSCSRETELLCAKGKAPMAEGSEAVIPKGEKAGTAAEGLDTSAASAAVGIADLSCWQCGSLLYRPVVLNCGHMFCEHCVMATDADALRCPMCQADHPGMFPQVCLPLHEYIDRILALEYAQRAVEVATEQSNSGRRPRAQRDDPDRSGSDDTKAGVVGAPRRGPAGPVHCAIGCDGCGMMPIMGKRFQCQECPKAIGFDLCGKCHGYGVVRGRFNQCHTSAHLMVEIKPPSRALRRMVGHPLEVRADRATNRFFCNDPQILRLLQQQRQRLHRDPAGFSSIRSVIGISPDAVAALMASSAGESAAPDGDHVLQDGHGNGNGNGNGNGHVDGDGDGDGDGVGNGDVDGVGVGDGDGDGDGDGVEDGDGDGVGGEGLGFWGVEDELFELLNDEDVAFLREIFHS